MKKNQGVLDLIPEITNRIISESDPEKIILFGSFARDDFDPDSDLDLLIIMRNVDSSRKEANRLRHALKGLLIPIDVIVATIEQVERHRDTVGLIYKSILSEGKVLYERPRIV